jgi:hypothetical protein
MSRWDAAPEILSLAEELGVGGAAPVDGILDYCRGRIDGWVAEAGGVTNINALESLVTQRLQMVFEEIRTDDDWDRLKEVYARGKKEFVFAGMRTKFDDEDNLTYGALVQRRNVGPDDPDRFAADLEQQGGITTDLLHSACKKGNALFGPVEVVLKGKEGKLPDGASFQDKDGHVRTEIRTRWYLAPNGHTYRTYALQSDEIECDLGLDQAVIAAAAPYPPTAKPVFVGHYWLSANRPEVLAENVACLDFSVAKGGFLCAYRWNGEQKLSNENFVWAKGGKLANA